MLRVLNEMSAAQCQALLTQLEQSESSSQPELERVQPEKEIGQQVQLWEATQLVEAIWEQARVGLPQLKTATFEEYQIQPDPSGQPELYRVGEKVLEQSGGVYQSDGLTQSDLERLGSDSEVVMCETYV